MTRPTVGPWTTMRVSARSVSITERSIWMAPALYQNELPGRSSSLVVHLKILDMTC